jgi:hypothetical protein
MGRKRLQNNSAYYMDLFMLLRYRNRVAAHREALNRLPIAGGLIGVRGHWRWWGAVRAALVRFAAAG